MEFKQNVGILTESRLRESSYQVKTGKSNTKSLSDFFDGAKFIFKVESLPKFYVKMTLGSGLGQVNGNQLCESAAIIPE